VVTSTYHGTAVKAGICPVVSGLDRLSPVWKMAGPHRPAGQILLVDQFGRSEGRGVKFPRRSIIIAPHFLLSNKHAIPDRYVGQGRRGQRINAREVGSSGRSTWS
jgi:hypothetical protein